MDRGQLCSRPDYRSNARRLEHEIGLTLVSVNAGQILPWLTVHGRHDPGALLPRCRHGPQHQPDPWTWVVLAEPGAAAVPPSGARSTEAVLSVTPPPELAGAGTR